MNAIGVAPQPIPLTDGRPTFRRLWSNYQEAVNEVMLRGKYSHGFAIQELEHEIANATGARLAVGVNSGADALLIGLKAVGIEAGDEVIVSNCGSAVTAMAVALIGAIPIFVDVLETTFAINTANAAKLVTDRTRAIIHTNPIVWTEPSAEALTFAGRYNLKSIEYFDGNFSTFSGNSCAAAFSASSSSTLGAIGDAGVILTNDVEIAIQASLLRHHGRTGDTIGRMPGVSNRAEICGTNSKMDDFQASYLRLRLSQLEVEAAEKQRALSAYLAALGRCGEHVKLPVMGATLEAPSIPISRFIVRTCRKEELADFLAESHIATECALKLPVSRQPCFRHHEMSRYSYPITEKFADEALVLPFYSGITMEQIDHVCSSIRKFFKL